MESKLVIIGLPASGKTTFLAAFWHVIEAEEIECRLRLDRYEGDLSYLNEISEAWRSFHKVPRTSQRGDVDVVMFVQDRTSGEQAQIFFPDLAGETFDQQIEARRSRPEFVDGLQDDDGIMLFISANVRQDSVTINELNAQLPAEEQPQIVQGTAGQAEPAGDTGTSEPAGDAASIEWQPRHIPAQVRIVQILSDLGRAPFAPKRRALAIIISAWDLVASMQMSPEAWLASHLPLVHQYLQTNAESFDAGIFGLSAQGVRLDDKDAVAQASEQLPSHRISLIGDGEDGHDITVPITWLMAKAQKRAQA